MLGVELAATGELIGDLVLFFRSREHRGGELGYVLDPDFAGRGYATEAAAALLDLAFGGLGLHQVVARLDEHNDASARMAGRLACGRRRGWWRASSSRAGGPPNWTSRCSPPSGRRTATARPQAPPAPEDSDRPAAASASPR